MTENQQARKKLQKELRNLFQFDVSDLDFGIYRILNRKKDQIEKFIEKDLLDAVEKGLEAYQAGDRKKFEEQLEKSKNKIPPQAFDEHGKIKEDFEGFEDVKKYQEAEKALKNLSVSEDTEKKIYNDLFTFFSRYYSDGDFVTKRRISTRDSKYAVPYNGEEVLLHWANKDQYYIKTGEHFTNYKFEMDGKSVWFKVAQAEQDRDNVKEEEKRSFVLRPENPIEVNDDELTVWFEYRPLTDEEEVKWRDIYNKVENKNLKGVDRQKLCIAYDEWIRNEVDGEWRKLLSVIPQNKDRSILYQKLNHYTGKNSTDYFIHKDLQNFLERELEYYLKNEVIRVDDFIEDQTEQAMDVALIRAKVVRSIGKKIMAFLSQIENFQKKLFEKRKFVVDTHYCFTLERVPEELYEAILQNEQQLKAWEELYALEKWSGELKWDGKWTKGFLKENPYMMVDTKNFESEDFKYALISSFDSIDAELNGVLVNGDNFHGLNLVKAKFKNSYDVIYIDPPYNTERDRETGKFIYKDGYSKSSWASLINDRVHISKELLSEEGVFVGSIDDNEVTSFREILNNLYGENNLISNIVWKSRSSVSSDHKVSLNHNYHLVYSKDHQKVNFGGFPLDKADYDNPDEDPRGPWKLVPIDANKPGGDTYYPIKNPNTGEEYYPPNGRSWAINKEDYNTLFDDNRILFGKKGDSAPKKKLFYLERIEKGDVLTPISFWDGPETTKDGTSTIMNLFGSKVFDYPKPVETIKDLIFISRIGKKIKVLDFFAGSGTTAHSLLRIQKQLKNDIEYLLMEMGNHFNEVLKPRIKKVSFTDKWRDGVPQDLNGQSHAFKYHFIESYEDALNNIDFKNLDDNQEEFEFEDYKLHYMLDFETRGVSASLLKDGAFDTPFDYKLKIQRGHEPPVEETVDLVETFHYLIGLWVQKLRRLEHQNRKYIISIGQIRDEDAVEDVCTIWRNTKDLDLDEEAGWIQKEIIKDQTFDRIYINGVNKVKDAEPIEITFREKMFEDVV